MTARIGKIYKFEGSYRFHLRLGGQTRAYRAIIKSEAEGVRKNCIAKLRRKGYRIRFL